MRLILAVVAMATMAAVSGCRQESGDEAAKRLDAIEGRIMLPDGALPLERYARYYFDSGSGRVSSVWFVPAEPDTTPDSSCEDMASGKVAPCPDLRGPVPEIPAGSRIWVSDRDSLPGINDGGCHVLDFTFDELVVGPITPDCNGKV